jgi:predicted RNase H-like nuclease (RuvC/YqgF family)
LNRESEQQFERYEVEIKELKQRIEKYQKEIEMLENQLRSIAGGSKIDGGVITVSKSLKFIHAFYICV